ncbi:MAG: hypothetical protein K1X74_07800 [Pirellulales bacterium]|nr:hypothetical protein [Pirellulales bacterium]
MSDALLDRLAADVLALIEPPHRNPLGPGRPDAAKRSALAALAPESLFADGRLGNRSYAEAAIAGLWLYHNFLDESHTVSQGLDDAAGAFWHGIMHRREPDPGNAKYWFRRVPRHPIYAELATRARDVAAEFHGRGDGDAAAAFLLDQAAWDPFAWIDLCESARRGQNPCRELCETIQEHEWRLLFEDSVKAAGAMPK